MTLTLARPGIPRTCRHGPVAVDQPYAPPAVPVDVRQRVPYVVPRVRAVGVRQDVPVRRDQEVVHLVAGRRRQVISGGDEGRVVGREVAPGVGLGRRRGRERRGHEGEEAEGEHRNHVSSFFFVLWRFVFASPRPACPDAICPRYGHGSL